MEGVVLASRLLLALVFAVAGIAKLRDRDGTAVTLEQFGVPAALCGAGAVALPLAELAAAALLVADATAAVGAVVAVGLLALFGVAIAASLSRGEQPDCNCFGQLHSEPVGASTLVRNALLAVPAVLVLAGGHGDAGAAALGNLGDLDTATALAAAALAVAAAALALQAYVSVNLLRQHGRVLLRLEALEAGGGAGAPMAAAQRPAGLPVGTALAPLELESAQGERVALSELLGGDRTLVLAFVEPNCGSCRELSPELAERQRAADGPCVVPVFARTEPDAARAMASEFGFGRALLDPIGIAATRFEAAGTPAAVAISPGGQVQSELALGPDDVRRLFRTLDESLAGVELEALEGDRRPLAADGASRLVVFWSPTCGFCDAMLEDLPGLAGGPAGEQLVVVATGGAEANRAQGLAAPVLLDDGFAAVGEHVSVPGTPSAVRLDARGRVISAVAVGAGDVLALAGVGAGAA
jgi:thiol-disulfide isomerase/thioredoxin/uncharacterized membrane protein YphA (DoxX/SURF4 family)